MFHHFKLLFCSLFLFFGVNFTAYSQLNFELEQDLKSAFSDMKIDIDSIILEHKSTLPSSKSQFYQSCLKYYEVENLQGSLLKLNLLDSLSKYLLIENQNYQHLLVETEFLKLQKSLSDTLPISYIYRLNDNAMANRDIGNFVLSDAQYAETLKEIENRWGQENEGFLVVSVNRCRGLNNIGNYKKVISICKNLEKIVATIDLKNTEPHCGLIYLLGEAYLYKNDFTEAFHTFERCRNIIINNGLPKDERYFNTLAALAECLDQLNDKDIAEKYYLEALSGLELIVGKRNSNYINALNNLSEFYIKHESLSKAEPIVKEAYTLLNSIENPMSGYRYVSYFNLIKLNSLAETKVNVMPEIISSLNIFNDMVENLRPAMSEREENLFLTQKIPNVRQIIALASSIDSVEKNDLRKIYFSHILTKGIDRSVNPSRFVLEKAIENENEIENWKRAKKEIKRSFINGTADSIDSLNNIVDEIEKSIGVRRERSVTDESINSIQYALNSDDIVIDIYSAIATEDSLVYGMFIITNDKIETKTLFKTLKVSDAISANQNKQLVKHLYKILRSYSNVYVIPSGIFHRFSFVSLNVDGAYLFEARKLKILNTVLDVLDQDKVYDNDIDSVLLIGGLYYNPGDSIFQTTESQPRALLKHDYMYLPYTKFEVESINNLMDGYDVDVISGYDAKKSLIMEKLEADNYAVVHFSTHGFFNESIDSTAEAQSALFHAGLVMSGDRVNSNKLLNAYEISGLSMENCKLVVLSACNSGLGMIGSGDNVYGLQKAFQTAGVSNLLLTLNEVDDLATSVFMEQFYASMIDGESIYTAYTSAINFMKLNYDENTWSSFKFIGEGEEVIFPKAEAIYFHSFYLILALVTVCLFIFFYRSKENKSPQ